MEIKELVGGSEITIKLCGDFDEDTCEPVEKKIAAALLNEELKSIILDFEEVPYISSVGIQVLIKAHKKAIALEKDLSIGEMSIRVKEIFDVIGILPLFKYRG